MEHLHEIIKSVWTDIETDYNNSYILNEDTLKNAFYFHLRTALAQGEEYKDYRIFTECTQFGFSDGNKRPDMIIVKISNKKADSQELTIDEITEQVVAVFEFKYKHEGCANVCEKVMYDFDKLRAYHRENRKLSTDCLFYVVAITHGEFTEDAWFYDKRTLNNWGKDRLKEFVAYGKPLRFIPPIEHENGTKISI